MNFKKYKWPFYIFTFLLITVVATVLSAMKEGDKVPDVSNAILLVGAVYVVFILLYRLFQSFRDKQKDKEIIKLASEIFTDDEATTKSRKNFLSKVQLKKINTKYFLILIS